VSRVMVLDYRGGQSPLRDCPGNCAEARVRRSLGVTLILLSTTLLPRVVHGQQTEAAGIRQVPES
jgi:hypothetical protein